MSVLAGKVYDGRSSTPREGILRVHNQMCTLQILGGVDHMVPVKDLEVSPRLGDIPRVLKFPNGTVFETADNNHVDQIIGTNHLESWVDLIERQWATVLICTVLLLFFAMAAYRYVLPNASAKLAYLVPQKMIRNLSAPSREAMALLPPADLDKSVAQDLSNVFRELESKYPNLHVRFQVVSAGKRGSNAFAAPDGSIYITDKLVKLKPEPRYWRAVLLHEVGHVYYQHSLRELIERSALQVFFYAIIGDIDKSAVPALLAENAHSQAYELEADAFAGQELALSGQDPLDLVITLKAIAKDSFGALSFLSTHPPSTERIHLLEQISQGRTAR